MKKFGMLVLALCLFANVALAQETTVLPFGVNFQMNEQEVRDALGNVEIVTDMYDEGVGSISIGACDTGIEGLEIIDGWMDINCNNSEGKSRLAQMTLTLSTGDDIIAAFKQVLAALTNVYGQPDSDPFDESGVQDYSEYGTLSAMWTKEDVRFSLSMYRMYGDSMTLDVFYRLNYDVKDLGL